MPSANVLEVKAARVAELEAKLKDAASFVIVDYKGITVADDTVLRRNLREANVEYFVEKNTLLKRALHNLGMESYDEVLNGTTAIAISQDDQTAPARILGEYAEKATGDFKLKAGCVEGEYFDGSVQDPVQGCTSRTARWFPAGTDPEACCSAAGDRRQERRGCVSRQFLAA